MTSSDDETLVARARDLVRTGDHASAARELALVQPPLTAITKNPRGPQLASAFRRANPERYVLFLRRATLEAEIAEHDGVYERARTVLRPFVRAVNAALKESDDEDPIVAEFQNGDTSGVERGQRLFLTFPGKNIDWRVLRQELYFLWQLSVLHYRDGKIEASGIALHRALRLAQAVRPKVEGLLIQLYYGAAKLAFHQGDYDRATALYGESFQSAERRLQAPEKVVSAADVAAARYSIGKTFALGLGQCLREQGRFEDARTVVTAGRLLLELTPDRILTNHAGLLLGSIERGKAGESNPTLLASARMRLDAAVEFFRPSSNRDVYSDSWFRAHYELGLALMQASDTLGARRTILTLIKKATANARDKWVANGHIALSRIERRARRYGPSVAAATKAVKVSVDAGIERIARRARTTLALALYDLAVRSGVPDPAGLDNAEKYLRTALDQLEPNDTRNRVMLLLVTAQIRIAKKNIAGAQEAYDEYQKIGYWVQSGRVREIGESVRRELAAATFRAPIDHTDTWDRTENVAALEAYLVQKVQRRHPNARTGTLAAELGVSSKVFRDMKKGTNPASARKHRLRAQRGRKGK